MKLNKEQLQQISAFISKRGFTHHDLKLEILDHMACKVEELMSADHSLTIDQAISKTHAQFGALGLSVFEDAMRDSLRKKYWRYFRENAASYFRPKYLPLVIGGALLIYLLAWKVHNVQTVFYTSWGILIVSMIADGLIKYQRLYRYRSMLTMQMGNISLITVSVLFQSCNIFQSMINRDNYNGSNIPYAICAVFMTTLVIYYLTMRRVQHLALNDCRELEEQYQLTVGN